RESSTRVSASTPISCTKSPYSRSASNDAERATQAAAAASGTKSSAGHDRFIDPFPASRPFLFPVLARARRRERPAACGEAPRRSLSEGKSARRRRDLTFPRWGRELRQEAAGLSPGGNATTTPGTRNQSSKRGGRASPSARWTAPA